MNMFSINVLLLNYIVLIYHRIRFNFTNPYCIELLQTTSLNPLIKDALSIYNIGMDSRSANTKTIPKHYNQNACRAAGKTLLAKSVDIKWAKKKKTVKK